MSDRLSAASLDSGDDTASLRSNAAVETIEDLRSNPAKKVNRDIDEEPEPSSNPTSHAPATGEIAGEEESIYGLKEAPPSSSADFDVVLVHGIRDSRDTVWKAPPQYEDIWIEGWQFNWISRRVLYFWYDITSSSAPIYTPGGIGKVASMLLDGLKELRHDTQRPLIFIARDLGGIITKKALTIACREPQKYSNLAYMTAAQIYFNCPHRNRDNEQAEDTIIKLMCLPGPACPPGIIRKARALAVEIQDINNDFLYTNLLVRAQMCNFFTRVEKPDPGTENQSKTPTGYSNVCIVTEDQVSFQLPYEEVSETKLPHLDLAKGLDPAYPRRIDAVYQAVEESRYDDLGIINRSAIGRRILLSQCSPVRPLLVTSKSKDDPFWLWFKEQDTFKKWYAYERIGTHILYLHGSSRVSAFSQRVYLALDELRAAKKEDDWLQPIFFYQFQQHDSRFNNTRGLLVSWLAQMACRLAGRKSNMKVARISTFLRDSRAFSLKDLFQCFEDMRFNEFVSGAIFMISCAEQCDGDLRWVIQKLHEWSDYFEQPLRVIITSSDSTEWKDISKGYATIDLGGYTNDAKYDQTDPAEIGAMHHRLLEDHPTLEEEDIAAITKFIELHPSDTQICRMAMAWIVSPGQHNSSKARVLGLLNGTSPVSPKTMFGYIAGSIPDELQTLCKNTIILVKNVCHPLSVRELASAVAMAQVENSADFTNRRVDHTVDQLLRIFPGLFDVKYGEVHFAHDSLLGQNIEIRIGQETCPASDPTGTDGGLEDGATTGSEHSQIASLCLRYLQLPMVQDQIEALFLEHHSENHEDGDYQYVAVPSRNDWIAYAVESFSYHYLLSGHDRPAREALGFFACKETRRAWVRANYTLSNPVVRSTLWDLETLPALARAGLHDLVQIQLELDNSSESLEADRWLAVAEAARYGHFEIVRLLMDNAILQATGLRDVIAAAAAHGDENMIQYLVDTALKLENFEWPVNLLWRVAWLGLESVVKTLVDAGVDVNPADPPDSISPLQICMRGRHEGVAKILLDRGADVHAKNKSGETSLFSAMRWGHPGIVRMVLDAGVDVNAKRDDGERPVGISCIWSTFQAIAVLLTAKPETDSTVEGPPNPWQGPPLTIAAVYGYQKCLKQLVEHGADVSATARVGTALHAAVSENWLDIARVLLENGANPNHTTETFRLPLLTAVSAANTPMVELLLQHKADIEMEDKSGSPRTTALAKAAGDGNKELVELLRQRGADVNHMGAGSQSPLFASVYLGRPDIVKYLLEAGANVNAAVANPDTWAPLHASYDAPDITTMLVEKGADVNQISKDGTLLFIASRWDFEETVNILLKSGPDLEKELIDEDDAALNGMTPLCIACQEGNIDVMRALLEAGANPNHKTRDGSFPLEFCFESSAEASGEEAVRALLEYRPRLDMRDDDGNTVLNDIDEDTPVALARLLVNAGADFTAVNKKGETPLLSAVESGNYEVARYLISKGASPRTSSAESGTCLRFACKNNQIEMVKLLVEAGADVNEIDPSNGESPLYASLTPKVDLELVKYLVAEHNAELGLTGGYLTFPIIRASQRAPSNVLRYMLEDAGADPNAQDQAGRRPVHVAMKAGIENLEILLALDVDINTPDKLGRTALHYAAALGSDEHVQMVLDKSDLDVNARDGDGWTPLMWACRNAEGTNVKDIVDALKARGADVWAIGSTLGEQWSALKVARYHYVDQDLGDDLVKLEPGQKTRTTEGGRSETWDDKFHQTRGGWQHEKNGFFCDGCFCVIVGICWHCKADPEPGYDLCFKCYKDRELLHPQHGDFLQRGEKYAPETDPDSGTESDTDDDTGTEDDDEIDDDD